MNSFDNSDNDTLESNSFGHISLATIWSAVSAMLLLLPVYALGVFQLSVTPLKAETLCTDVKSGGAEVEEIAPNIFVRPGKQALMTADNLGGIANISFVIGEKKVAVIDTGGSYCDGLSLRRAIRLRTKLPIAYVINTHAHPDHMFGNAAFVKDKPVIIGHKNLKRAMQNRGGHYLQNFERLMGKKALAGTKVILPTQSVSKNTILDLGGHQLELTIHQVSHTDQDLTVFHKTEGILWAGDLLFLEHIPVIDGSLLGWLKVMEQLAQIKAVKAVPGHGPASVNWPEGLTPQKEYLTTLVNEIREMIKKGGTMLEAQQKVGLRAKDKWHLFEEFNARNVSAAFAELEWE